MRILIPALACLALSVAVDAAFLPHQSLWNDEATQLAGLTLRPVEVVKWLAGREEHDFGVPDDRMPPLSYLGGKAWSKLFGPGERSLRWFGVACVAIASGVVAATASRAWGPGAGVASGLLLATSPNVVVLAVEIRAYPVLILASSAIFACLVGLAQSPPGSRRGWLGNGWLWGMVACSVAAIYTHFFGLVAAGGAFVGALGVAWRKREPILPILLAGAVVGAFSFGLAPFVFASTRISEPHTFQLRDKLIGVVRLIYRLFGHPATSLSPVAVAMAALGLTLGLVGGLWPRKLRSGWASLGLALALASGFAVVVLVHLAQSFFPAVTSHYNVWMLPALALLVGSGLEASSRPIRTLSLAGVVLLVAANAFADAQLAYRGDAFAHTPARHIAALIREHEAGGVAVIHDNDKLSAWAIYAPLRSDFGAEFAQYRPEPETSGQGPLLVSDYPNHRAEGELLSLPFATLIVIRSEIRTAAQIASVLDGRKLEIDEGPATRALLASGDWERVKQHDYLSFVAARVDVFRKIQRP